MNMRGGNVSADGKQEIKDSKKTISNILGIVKEFRGSFILAILLSLVGTVFQVAGPYILGMATNEIAQGVKHVMQGTGTMDMVAITRILFMQIGAYLGSAVFNYMQALVLAKMSQKLVYDLRGRIQAKLKRLPLAYFDTNTLGDVLSRVTNDTQKLSSGLEQSLPNLINSVLTVILILAGMLFTSVSLTVIGLITLPLSFILTIQIMKRSQDYFRGQQQGLGDIGGFVEEMYSGHDVVRAYGREEQTIEEFSEINDTLYNNASKAQFASGLMQPITQFSGNIGYVFVAVVGAFKVLNPADPFGVGNIQTFIQYLRQFTNPIQQVAGIMSEFQSTIAASERVFDFLDEPEEEPETLNPQTVKNPTGQVDLSHVKFGYVAGQPLINDLSIELKSGDMVALVGPTGAGKTTLVNLLLRFYDIQGGSISIDGVNIMDMTRSDLRSMFGMVLQDTWLYSASIADNIRYGKLGATDEEVIEASKTAYADSFIRTLPGGYGMVLGEDADNLSGGQRQLITIARALLSDPTILILDEATSSVDTRTEVLIQKAMARLMKNRTSFVIAHRLSTIRDANVILVLKDGDIVESGSHEELLAKNGFYTELYYSQLAGNET